MKTLKLIFKIIWKLIKISLISYALFKLGKKYGKKLIKKYFSDKKVGVAQGEDGKAYIYITKEDK